MSVCCFRVHVDKEGRRNASTIYWGVVSDPNSICTEQSVVRVEGKLASLASEGRWAHRERHGDPGRLAGGLAVNAPYAQKLDLRALVSSCNSVGRCFREPGVRY